MRSKKNCTVAGHWVNDTVKMAEGGKGIADRVGSGSARQRHKGAAIMDKT